MLILFEDKYSQWMHEHPVLIGALNLGLGLFFLAQGVSTLRKSKGEDPVTPGISGGLRRFIGFAFILLGVLVCAVGVSSIRES